MGKHARIAELEDQLSALRAQLADQAALTNFIRTLAELPDDAVLLYTLSGQQIQHEIGRGAKRILEAMENQ